MKKEVLTAAALEALLQAPLLAIHAVDKQGHVIFWSPSASRMFGWTESEVLGRFLPIVPEDSRQEVYDRIQRDLKGESIGALDVRRLRKDGSLVDISLWSAPLRDSTGEVIGILGLYADITARKQGEEALQSPGRSCRRCWPQCQTIFGAVKLIPMAGSATATIRHRWNGFSGDPQSFFARARGDG